MKGSSGVKLHPTAGTGGVGLVVLMCWYSGTSQGNGAALALGALLVGATAVSVAVALRNLSGMRIHQRSPARGFAGEPLRVGVEVACPEGVARGLRLAAAWGGGFAAGESVDAGPEGTTVDLIWKPDRRGWHDVTGLKAESRYPFGWVRASVALEGRLRCLVYPKPAGRRSLPWNAGVGTHRNPAPGEDGDFDGHRIYRVGDSQRRVDWKASARREELMLKVHRTAEGQRLLLEWDRAGPPDVEARLSQLCLWVCEAERRGLQYALQLPGHSGGYGRGQRHYRETLQRLAEFSPSRSAGTAS